MSMSFTFDSASSTALFCLFLLLSRCLSPSLFFLFSLSFSVRLMYVFRLSCHHTGSDVGGIFSSLLFSSSVYRLSLINFALCCHCHLLSLSLPFAYVLFFFAGDAKTKIPTVVVTEDDCMSLLTLSLSLYFVPKYTLSDVCTNKNE